MGTCDLDPRARARTLAGAHTCAVGFRQDPSVPRRREHEERPAAGREKMPKCQKKNIYTYSYVVIYTYIYFNQWTPSTLQNDELPTLEPGTRSRISTGFMPPGHETPRARRGGAPQAGGRSSRPSCDACAEPLLLEGSPETRAVPSSWAGPSQNGTFSGGGIVRKSRAERSTVNYFRFGWTRVCIRESVCTE